MMFDPTMDDDEEYDNESVPLKDEAETRECEPVLSRASAESSERDDRQLVTDDSLSSNHPVVEISFSEDLIVEDLDLLEWYKYSNGCTESTDASTTSDVSSVTNDDYVPIVEVPQSTPPLRSSVKSRYYNARKFATW